MRLKIASGLGERLARFGEPIAVHVVQRTPAGHPVATTRVHRELRLATVLNELIERVHPVEARA
jgi:spore maturation protein SpmA